MPYPDYDGDSFGNQGSQPPYGGQPYAGQPFGGQPYGAGQAFGGQPYGPGQPYREPGPTPHNHVVWAVLVTVVSLLVCNLVSLTLGIIALVNSNKVSTLWAQGRLAEALEASRQAKRLSIWGAVVMVGSLILGGIGYFLLIATLTSLPAF